MKLYPFQEEGVHFALRHPHCLIADEMGLGKTVQAIEVLARDRSIRRVLIVCPKSLMTNWQAALFEQLSTARYAALYPRIINYEKLGTIHETFDCVIVDEAHAIKNPSAQRTVHIQNLCRSARRVLFLTGTPIENRPMEIWTLLEILDPFTWGAGAEARHNFGLRYCAGIRKVINWGSFKQGRSGGLAWDYSGASNTAELGQLLRETVMIRRLKSEVLTELPDKIREIVLTPFKEADGDLIEKLGDFDELSYDDAVKKLHTDKVLFEEWSRRRHLQGLEKVDFAADYIKRRLEGHAVSAAGAKIIVFAHHEDVIAGLSEALRALKIQSVFFTGKMTVDQRALAVHKWRNQPKVQVILGSIGAMGVGLTLTESAHEIFVELDPVPAKMSQAEDRAHRIGQRDVVLVEHLVADGSLDARICKILVRKQKILKSVLDTTGESIPQEYSQKDSQKEGGP